MKNVIAITQARMSSTRLPGKVMKTMGSQTMLGLHISRISRSRKITKLVVATTENSADDIIVMEARKYHAEVFRGSETDVLDRYYQAARTFNAEIIIRITSDCPLIDPVLIDRAIVLLEESGKDYVANIIKLSFPDGQDTEAFTFATLERAWKEAVTPYDREHVTPYIRTHAIGAKSFNILNFENETDLSNIRMTVDSAEDFLRVEEMVKLHGIEVGWKEYLINN